MVTGQLILYGSLLRLAKVLAYTSSGEDHTKNVVHLRYTTCGYNDYGIVDMKPQLWNQSRSFLRSRQYSTGIQPTAMQGGPKEVSRGI